MQLNSDQIELINSFLVKNYNSHFKFLKDHLQTT